MLDANGIDQYYGGSHTLPACRCQVRQNECLLGTNGVGKTTLLRMPDGRAAGGARRRVAGRRRHPLARRHARKPQGRDIFAADGGREHPDGHGDQAGRARIKEVFELFPVLRGMLSQRGARSSGGQQQPSDRAGAGGRAPHHPGRTHRRDTASIIRTSDASSACCASAATSASCCASSTSTSPAAGRPLRGAVARRGRGQRRPRNHGRRGRAPTSVGQAKNHAGACRARRRPGSLPEPISLSAGSLIIA